MRSNLRRSCSASCARNDWVFPAVVARTRIRLRMPLNASRRARNCVSASCWAAVSGGDPAPAGTAGEATFRLRGIAPGTQAVTLDQVRPGFATPARSVAFDVTVR